MIKLPLYTYRVTGRDPEDTLTAFFVRAEHPVQAIHIAELLHPQDDWRRAELYSFHARQDFEIKMAYLENMIETIETTFESCELSGSLSEVLHMTLENALNELNSVRALLDYRVNAPMLEHASFS